MTSKLTPRQNELISETLCRIAAEECENERTPEILKTIRRALVRELQEVEVAPAFFGEMSVVWNLNRDGSVSISVYIDGRPDASYAPVTVEQAKLVMADVISGREPPRDLYRRGTPPG